MNAILIILLSLLPLRSHAAVHYVSQSDTGSHFTSVTAGIAFADSGDTVCVYPGTYAESSEVVISKPLCITTRGFVMLVKDSRYTSKVRITADSVTLRGITYINTDSYITSATDMIILDSVSYCVLDSIVFKNVYLGGIVLHGSDYNTISNCTFNNIGDTNFAACGQQRSILLSNSRNNSIINTRIACNTGAGYAGNTIPGGVYVASRCTGIQIQHGSTANSILKSAVINNRGMRICGGHPGGCLITHGIGIIILDSSTCSIDSSDIYGNTTEGIRNTSLNRISTQNVWWGSWHGPRTVDDTASNSYYQETISGDIDYSPWAIAPYFPDLWDSLSPLLPGETGIDDPLPGRAERITLSPMPFKTSLQIQSKILTAGMRLPVYDRAGRMVTAITVPHTTNELHWDGSVLPEGIYFIGIGGTFHKIIRSK